ncbi:uncharacterized protein G2W53_030683 [Senna tora]|uniref:Uncharacterized protein n=1 Tax=Senna tora TaxID=362788 RepID=A0A834T6W8_9FABA|nr:uncharacterized protein G2W53_030683 [Senna tora]
MEKGKSVAGEARLFVNGLDRAKTNIHMIDKREGDNKGWVPHTQEILASSITNWSHRLLFHLSL